MKIIKLIVLSLFAASCVTQKIQKKSSPVVKLPSYTIKKLSNGLEVLFIQDKKLPLFQLSLLIPSGSINDPKGKSGVASMTGNLLKMGTLKRSANQITDSFEQKGSSFSVNVSSDYVMVEGSSLSQFKGDLFTDFIEVLTQPKFSWSEFSRYRKKIKAQNSKSLDDASYVASLAVSKILYPDHPYGNKSSGTAKSISRITQKDIVKFYKAYYRPKGSMLAVVGDFDQSEITTYLELLEKKWGNIKEVKQVEVPELANKASQIHLIHKPEAKQTQLRFGHMGISRNNKDFITLRVANAILGQGFSSRLLTEVRVKKGLTYTIRSSFNAGKYTGPFMINTFTRHDKVKETIDTVLATTKTYLTDGVTDSELEVAKQYLKGTFPRALETSTSVAYNVMLLKYLNVPLDYLKNYLSDVDKVTKEDIKRAANKYIQPQNFQIIVLSDKSKVESQLKDMGEIKNYSYKDFN